LKDAEEFKHFCTNSNWWINIFSFYFHSILKSLCTSSNSTVVFGLFRIIKFALFKDTITTSRKHKTWKVPIKANMKPGKNDEYEYEITQSPLLHH